jgi:hypothetical protein
MSKAMTELKVTIVGDGAVGKVSLRVSVSRVVAVFPDTHNRPVSSLHTQAIRFLLSMCRQYSTTILRTSRWVTIVVVFFSMIH